MRASFPNFEIGDRISVVEDGKMYLRKQGRFALIGEKLTICRVEENYWSNENNGESGLVSISLGFTECCEDCNREHAKAHHTFKKGESLPFVKSGTVKALIDDGEKRKEELFVPGAEVMQAILDISYFWGATLTVTKDIVLHFGRYRFLLSTTSQTGKCMLRINEEYPGQNDHYLHGGYMVTYWEDSYIPADKVRALITYREGMEPIIKQVEDWKAELNRLVKKVLEVSE